MELEIQKKEKNSRRRTPYYELIINFMEGDADDYHEEEVIIEPEEIDDYKNLIFAVECCNQAYQNGRGGYDEYYGILEYCAFFGESYNVIEYYNPSDFNLDENISDEDFLKFLENKFKEINPKEIIINHPCDCNSGISDSFDGYSLLYFDENGDSYPVKITFSEKEKERLNHIMTMIE